MTLHPDQLAEISEALIVEAQQRQVAAGRELVVVASLLAQVLPQLLEFYQLEPPAMWKDEDIAPVHQLVVEEAPVILSNIQARTEPPLPPDWLLAFLKVNPNWQALADETLRQYFFS